MKIVDRQETNILKHTRFSTKRFPCGKVEMPNGAQASDYKFSRELRSTVVRLLRLTKGAAHCLNGARLVRLSRD